MEENKNRKVSLFARISILINTLLFGITGILYLMRENKIIGYVLLAAGLLNIIYILFTINTKNLFFAILNFIFALVSLTVTLDYLYERHKTTMGIVWMIIALYYIITGFIIMLQIRKKPPETKKGDLGDQT